MPLIFFGTLVLLLIGGEVTARLLYPQDDAAEPCELHTPAGSRYTPFCTSHTKVWEGPWVTQHFNDCGYRTEEPCKPRPSGALRVVVLGSSTARGALVNYPESFAARASAFFTRRCRALVDFQNLGTEPPDVDRIDRRMKEAMALHPAAIVMTVGPYDLIHLMDPPHPPGQAAPDAHERIDLRWFVNRLRDSRLFLLMQYYLYRDPAFQVRAFLLNGDPADYVRQPLSPAWQKRVNAFGDLLGRMSAQADVPLLVVYIPERAQAALAKEEPDPPGIDPFVLQRALRRVASAHDAVFLDSTPDFAQAADFEGLFYLTDGHPREGGHAAIAETVESGLLAEPAFAACGPES
ncbi:MAG TPA: hypothetical protein VFG62_09615 [Rhodopila sp.]|nr:hypothetical protein [Rhodopila sp.]